MPCELKHAVMTGMMGRIFDRFHEYQPAIDFPARLERAAAVEGAQGVEVVYPQEFPDPDLAVARIRAAGVAVSAVNLNVKGEARWRRGSFTAPDAAIRRQAVEALKIAMDLAAELGAEMVSCCPLIDGHNYSFQADYLKQWDWLEEGLAAGAAHRADVVISLEYKLNESRNYCILGDMGRALLLCERLGAPNVGVTMDVGHALIARETPAEMLAIAHGMGRLRYVHFNDNGGEWDWDMLPGAVHWWDLVEMMYYLDRIGWNGWLAYDVVTRDGDPVEEMGAAIAIVKHAAAAVEQIGRERIGAMIEEGIPARAFGELVRRMVE